jgi:hypothetical protein
MLREGGKRKKTKEVKEDGCSVTGICDELHKNSSKGRKQQPRGKKKETLTRMEHC